MGEGAGFEETMGRATEASARLAERPGRVWTRQQLLDRLQGAAFEGYERAIDSHVKNLRHKLEPGAGQPRYVQTVFGIGYKLGDPEDGDRA